ncbi:MAG: hypothetical protein H3C31_10730 [Brumimicrobium sp.]|nr:hypothetical protein [Brumimicrobium sp.]MCO5267552.1 hypothetical protein [Brumimicrobium sp.]
MSRFIGFIGLCFILLILSSSTPSYSYRVSFGVKIGLLPTGSLTEYSIIYYRDNKQISSAPIDLYQLDKICLGEWPIPKTQTFFNYYENFGLHDDTLVDGTIVDFRSAYDSLWKIRFDFHPFNFQSGKGWSNGEIRPSLKQQAYLYQRYGVRGYDQDSFSDSAFFQLLKDVCDPIWIADYKSLY